MNKAIWMVGSMILRTALVAGCGPAAGNNSVSPHNAAGGRGGSKPATRA